MSFARVSLSLVGIAGVVAVALAGGIIWLMITQPVMVADSVAKGEYSPLAQGDRRRAVRRAGGLLKYSVAARPLTQAALDVDRLSQAEIAHGSNLLADRRR